MEEYQLPELVGKEDDPRKGGFIALFGSNVQVEVDALAPDDLRYLYRTVIDELWDESIYQDVLAQEADERGQLIALADEWGAGA